MFHSSKQPGTSAKNTAKTCHFNPFHGCSTVVGRPKSSKENQLRVMVDPIIWNNGFNDILSERRWIEAPSTIINGNGIVWYLYPESTCSQTALMSDIEKYLMITVSHQSSKGCNWDWLVTLYMMTSGSYSPTFDLKWSPKKKNILWSCWFEFCVACFSTPSIVCPLTRKTRPSSAKGWWTGGNGWATVGILKSLRGGNGQFMELFQCLKRRKRRHGIQELMVYVDMSSSKGICSGFMLVFGSVPSLEVTGHLNSH